MFYLSLFAITSVLFYFAQKFEQKGAFVLFNILSATAIILLAFVAGCRDNTIGVDIKVYGIKTFNLALGSKDFWEGFAGSRRELGYYAINYIASRFSSKIGLSFFLQNLTQHIFVFWGMKYYMKQIPLWLSMLIYQLYFYNLTLNLMCQGIALGFLIWSFKYVVERNFVRLLLCSVVCFFLHKSSAVAFLILFFITWVMGKQPKERIKYIVLTVIGGVVVLVFFTILLRLVSSAIPGMEYFVMYGGEPGKRGGGFEGNVPLTDVVMRLAMLFVALVCVRGRQSSIDSLHLFIFVVIFDLITLMFGRYAYFATRLCYYFFICDMVLFLKLIISESRVTIRSRTFISLSLLSIILFCCIKWNLIMNYPSTYPYTSEFLGIGTINGY